MIVEMIGGFPARGSVQDDDCRNPTIDDRPVEDAVQRSTRVAEDDFLRGHRRSAGDLPAAKRARYRKLRQCREQHDRYDVSEFAHSNPRFAATSQAPSRASEEESKAS